LTHRFVFLAARALALFASPVMAAQAAEPDAPPSVLANLPAFAPLMEARKQLDDRGLSFQLNSIGEVLGNPTGGARQGAAYDGRLELVVDADMEKILGARGAAIHANVLWLHGTGFSRYHLGNNLLTVSNIEALPTVRLDEFWFEQKLFDGRFSLRLGQIVADSEFLTSRYGSLFLNGTFGWPDFASANLPSGGPGYPLATPGVRVKLGADADAVNLLAVVFNGDPAGPCGQDPQRCDPYGVSFRLQDAPLAMQEIQFRYNQGPDDGLPGAIKFGAFEHAGHFRQQRFQTRLSGDWGFYGVWDQQIFKLGRGEDAAKGAAFFVRVGGAPPDRNFVSFYLDSGLNFSGLVPGRPDDLFGVSLAYARVSAQARAADVDAGLPAARHSETAFELTYLAQIAPGWSLQPDFQYIVSPGAGVVDARGARMKDAAVFGLRSTLNF